MRICIDKRNNKVIEMQSAGREGTLLNNAIMSGYNAEEIEEIEIDEATWENIVENNYAYDV